VEEREKEDGEIDLASPRGLIVSSEGRKGGREFWGTDGGIFGRGMGQEANYEHARAGLEWEWNGNGMSLMIASGRHI
jgi:hypothetical protein